MSNPVEIDYEKQFQEDLTKATALSLEQQALDEYRRAKKYRGSYGTSNASFCERSQGTITDYMQMHQLPNTISNFRGTSSDATPTSSFAGLPTNLHWHHSEVHNNKSNEAVLGILSDIGSSKTPPPHQDNDLISFASPASKTSENTAFECMIDDLHKLQTSNTNTALAHLGPIAVGATRLHRNPIGLYSTQDVQTNPSTAGAAAPGMQIVPFVPPAQQQKVPLTQDDLQKLYSMPQQQKQQPQHQQQYVLSFPPNVGFVAPRTGAITQIVPYQTVYLSRGSIISAASSAVYMQPSYSGISHGFYYGAPIPPPPLPPSSSSSLSAPLSVTPCYQTSFIPSRTAPSPDDSVLKQLQKSQSSPKVSGMNGTVPTSVTVESKNKSSMAAARRRIPPARKRVENDLIDLSQEDDSRVSVLEAFDPLHQDESNSGSEIGSDCTSYYAEYDPFDYLYSADTQYSDPVYEAVNNLERSVASPNVFSIGRGQEILGETIKPTSTTATTAESIIVETITASLIEIPPPLPPRNSSGNVNFHYENTSSITNNNSATIYSQPSRAVLDRRKTCRRLYEMLSDERTIDPELLEFYLMVKDLRLQYVYHDANTNVGHIVACEFNYHYPMQTSIKILVYPALEILYSHSSSALAVARGGHIKSYGAPVILTCDINTPVEMIIRQALYSLEGQIHDNVSDYVAKPIGLCEWLSPTSKLSQLECVHNSLKLERDVQLGLCLKKEENMEEFARTQRDDLRDSELRPEDVLPNEMATTITYDNMMILIETLETEIEKLKSAASDTTNTRSFVSCSGVVQGVKAICALLGSIDTLELAECVADLKRICSERQRKYSSSSQGNPEIVNDCGGDYSEVSLRPRSFLEQLKLKCNELRDAVQELIELYSHVFRVGFSVKAVDYTTTPIPISCVLKPIVVSINCLHRPPPSWKYDDYSLGVQINYGTRFISDPVVAKCSNDTDSGLFPRLNFTSWITFEKNQICTLPRESRLIFVLFGTQFPENSDASDANGERKQITTELGWCAIQLFDYRREMICGAYLLSMWPATADKFLGPAPARGCHPQPDICPVLSIEIPSYGGRIQFPEPLENPPPAPSYDFASLDANLQQELLDTAEQGYPGASDKREVFWEKRLYLQNIPNALPKVLHAAHSWDYASLIDLHSLLRSWSPLSALQALELLLPRYPDAKVRQKAVDWISQLPNDQLVDYLPQLLQSLKHDTYEASPMSRFLLCKCLESPRIAHHVYWLLVHSLPGDDPQNSIDDTSQPNEYDESLITQARYYRRNKMMLRALLAVCGEKLLARFLRQSMMCKNLAAIAETVKETKESHRQKALHYAIDTVHQELLNKPTSLPLGPELVVTGVNVRSCSYFNSNTLPLKISYIGPDGELLPAIFKSGDDLQQDMLTIQLIRVMNKMWLAEGLDLKMVTFNCVPTGYKKGMIELVSDAETLRKIQVEYGLTGSFKDRPIAEWLAKQNPSQLEYQRAVKNFTVSCAGYSVATYLLGICDRHNDNIMLKTSGHLFHIDFGKFLGDAQMFGNFKRDRTPFVLTSDMAYVINGGDKPSTDFHFFVDLCCRAFNIIRKHGDLILHMLALMATAGIPGVTADAVTYVRRALLPSQSNPEAAASFAKMIQFSLKSWFTQFNFFLHNIAQMRFSNDEGSGELLSFVPRKYTMHQDGRLKSVMVVRCQKHYAMEKYYTYILRVTRHSQPNSTHLFRSYKEFTEFHQKLCLHFPLAKLHSLPSGIHVGRSNVKSVAERRLPEIQLFLVSLFNSADEIAHSDLVYTFFHPLLRDQQEAKLEVSKVKGEVKEVKCLTSSESPYEVGQLKISLQYRRGALTVMIHHAKGLPLLQGNQEPNTYVKCYLKPDATKVTKRKTKVVRKTCVPSFMETLEYRMPLEYIQTRILHVTVWSHDTLQENELLGGFQIDLSKNNLHKELIDWFCLGPMSRN